MGLPKPIAPQTLNGLKSNPQLYEAINQTVQSHNQLIASLGPGTSVTASNFQTSSALSVSNQSGSVKRGKFSVKVGTNPAANETINLGFPTGSFASSPFAQVVRNGGSGASAFSYTESPTGLLMTIAKPLPGEEYSFQYAVQD